MKITKTELAKYIDHTLIKPYTTEEDVRRGCEEAVRYGFASLCIPPCYVKLASRLLSGSGVKVCTVIGFPMGYSKGKVKVFEAERAVEDGADELDMVINIGMLKAGCYEYVRKEIEDVVKVAKPHGVSVKVIIETCYLTDWEKKKACRIAKEAGADFVKTSTGFGTGGATIQDVELMRRAVGSEMGVKAAGGIRNAETAIAMIKAGANRIGTSSAVKIMEELEE